MSLPRLSTFLLRRCVRTDRVEDALGDLEEVHRERVERRGRPLAWALTCLEAAEIAAASLLLRITHGRAAPISWIDLKLGARMLAKYPALTLIGGLAMAFGIFAGAATFEFYAQIVHPVLPFEEGERVVDLSLVDDRSQGRESRLLHELEPWRAGLSTIEELGAAQPLVPNLATGEGGGEPVLAAAMTASAFRMARVPPLMGRTLGDADESLAAPPVAVVAHDLWRNRLGSDPDVIGRTVLVGDVEHTVVGVMPPGFAFPVAEQLWLPLRFDPASLEPLQGRGVLLFGRLAPGRTSEEALAELNALVARARSERPDVYEHLHGRVLPYAAAASGVTELSDPDRLAAMSVNLVAWLFLVLLCSNVALLMFARAASREGEIVVRTALGASRRRIVSQLFAEALVLCAVAAFVGVGAAQWAIGRFAVAALGGGPTAFWFHASLSPRTVVYSGVLAVIAALITGTLPGLAITSSKVDARLRRASAGGGGLRFGRAWTAIIVIQVAATVTFPVIGWAVGSEASAIRAYQPGFATDEFLVTGLRLNVAAAPDPSDAAERSAYTALFARTVEMLVERLDAEPGVRGVTRTAHVPGTYHNWRRIEMDGGGEAPRSELDEKGPGRWVSGGVVAPDFFDVLGAEALQGRTFHADDALPDARTVIVNEAFVEQVLGGRNPIGRRLRYLGSGEAWDGVRLGDEPGPWYRIVGVVPDLGMNSRGSAAGFYHAASVDSRPALTLLVRVDGPAPAFATRLREVAAEVDPDLALVRLSTLDEVKAGELRAYTYWMALIVGVAGLAVLLSLAGIYAVMAFAVARRTREIGVRVALGAGPSRVIWAIFRRPLLQVAGGLALGLLISAVLSGEIDAESFWGAPLLQLLAYGTVVGAVCLLACVVPVRRALAVEPSQALSADG